MRGQLGVRGAKGQEIAGRWGVASLGHGGISLPPLERRHKLLTIQGAVSAAVEIDV
jgi:hypothetical protein